MNSSELKIGEKYHHPTLGFSPYTYIYNAKSFTKDSPYKFLDKDGDCIDFDEEDVQDLLPYPLYNRSRIINKTIYIVYNKNCLKDGYGIVTDIDKIFGLDVVSGPTTSLDTAKIFQSFNKERYMIASFDLSERSILNISSDSVGLVDPTCKLKDFAFTKSTCKLKDFAFTKSNSI